MTTELLERAVASTHDGSAPFGQAVEVPEGAGPVERLAAFLGRTP